jgi:transcriptional regulator with XRE-family HTH domain
MKPRAKTLDEQLHRHGSLSRLARQLGISQSYLSEIRHGKKTPTLELALRISKVTGVPVESLVREAA